MLTKTLKFDQEVLNVLRAMRWENDGTLGIISGGQLDRKLYERLNKALEAMGGKWNRKAGGHVFDADPRPAVEGLLDNGTLAVEKDGFFETPEEVAYRMIQLINVWGLVLEPSAGLGAIAKVIDDESAFDCLVLVEKNTKRANALHELETASGSIQVYNADFLGCNLETFDLEVGFNAIVANPPFEEGQDIDHLRHMYNLLAPDGALVSVMSEGAFFRSDRKTTEFRRWFENVDGYSEKLPPNSFKDSGTSVNARLVVLRK